MAADSHENSCSIVCLPTAMKWLPTAMRTAVFLFTYLQQWGGCRRPWEQLFYCLFSYRTDLLWLTYLQQWDGCRQLWDSCSMVYLPTAMSLLPTAMRTADLWFTCLQQWCGCRQPWDSCSMVYLPTAMRWLPTAMRTAVLPISSSLDSFSSTSSVTWHKILDILGSSVRPGLMDSRINTNI